MNHFCVIIDSRRGYSRLGRCLQAITSAASSTSASIDVVLVADRVRARLVSLAERHGAQVTKLPPGTRGQRYNTIANTVQADALIFVDATAELPSEWLAHVEEALQEGYWNAVTLKTNRRPAWLGRLYRSSGRIMALAIRRSWFERVGGFDPEIDTSTERDLVGRLMACHARVLHQTGEGERHAG